MAFTLLCPLLNIRVYAVTNKHTYTPPETGDPRLFQVFSVFSLYAILKEHGKNKKLWWA